MSSREAIIVPGGQFGPFAPLLMFCADAAERRDATVTPVSWNDRDHLLTLRPEEFGPWVLDQVERAVPSVRSAEPSNTLLIGKSLGTHAATLTAELGLPAIWLTPVLTSDWVVSALRRSTAPFLLVGGTADSLWNSALARELTPYVLEVDDADHGMYVPGPLAASTAVLGQVATAAEEFLDAVLWRT
ncbi:alpha/beta hydrolase [Kribbella sp. NPDC058245]|uniref:alpha/beta hydrolase n=1 Tax=Kribbella sp. NPDC058245 TaxID=3346399 RepID=UPI0036E4B4E1